MLKSWRDTFNFPDAVRDSSSSNIECFVHLIQTFSQTPFLRFLFPYILGLQWITKSESEFKTYIKMRFLVITIILTKKLDLPIWSSPKRQIFKETKSVESLVRSKHGRAESEVERRPSTAMPGCDGDWTAETEMVRGNCLYLMDLVIQKARNWYQNEERYLWRTEKRQRIFRLIFKWNILRWQVSSFWVILRCAIDDGT